MGVIKRFNEIFGQEGNVEKERKRFVDRVNQVIFYDIDTESWEEHDYKFLFKVVCVELGVNAHDFRERERCQDFMI